MTPWDTAGVIGHAPVLALLRRLVEREQFPAATVFVGPPAVGKGTVARIAARWLLSMEGDVHPDFLALAFAEGREIRETLVALLHHAHQRPVVAPFRVLLFPNIDRLSDASASLLLKTIEDAPPFVKFFFTATIRRRVPVTIQSRAFMRELSPLSVDDLADELLRRGVPRSLAAEVALLAGGRPGLALKLAADAVALTRYRTWAACLSSGPGRWSLAETLDDPVRAEEFLIFLQGMFRAHALVAPRNSGSNGPLRSPSPVFLRRMREATAMLQQHVPPGLVVDYVLGNTLA